MIYTFSDCKYNGRTYRPGERFESFNGCGECICDSTGFVNCLDVLCDDRKLKFSMAILSNMLYINTRYHIPKNVRNVNLQTS